MDDQGTCRAVPSEANGAARQRRVEGGRQHVIKVKMDDAEYDAISELAADRKVSIQRLLVSGALASRPQSCAAPDDSAVPTVRVPVLAELAGLRRLVANLANNINQIARVLNSGGTPSGSIPAAADAVRRVMIRLDSVLAAPVPDSFPRSSAHSVPVQAAPPGSGSFRLPGPVIREAPS